jgi:hypothetical protein
LTVEKNKFVKIKKLKKRSTIKKKKKKKITKLKYTYDLPLGPL